MTVLPVAAQQRLGIQMGATRDGIIKGDGEKISGFHLGMFYEQRLNNVIRPLWGIALTQKSGADLHTRNSSRDSKFVKVAALELSGLVNFAFVGEPAEPFMHFALGPAISYHIPSQKETTYNTTDFRFITGTGIEFPAEGTHKAFTIDAQMIYTANRTRRELGIRLLLGLIL
jgi:hypothetical protein